MPNEKAIRLTTTFHGGHECVDRNPPVISDRRPNVDTIRIINMNPPLIGSSITVTLDPGTMGNVFVSAPSTPQVLKPGDSIVLNVKPGITAPQSEGFTTIPQSCQHHDSGDIIIQP